MERKRVLSGNRPTGRLHLGHLVGILDNWVQMQKDYDCFYEVADWHVLTTSIEDSSTIPEHTREMVLDWFAVGIDPEQSTVFVQSRVPEHAELHLLFSMLATVSRLERNPTYKEQINELNLGDQVSYGLLGYPVLQAADVLIYQAHAVPVGEDQLPHLEFTREMARRFNYVFGEVFPVPEPHLTRTARLPGIDGRKMSKSYNNAIFLTDDPDTVYKKVWNIVTDPGRIRLKDPGNPEVCHVYSFYQVFATERTRVVGQECREAERGCTDCKKELVEILVKLLQPIQKEREKYQQEPGLIEDYLAHGTEKAREEAIKTMKTVRQKMGVGRI